MVREINWSKLILAFLIACFMFSFGLMIGYLTSGLIEKTTLTLEDTTRNEFVNLETLTLLESSYPCNSFILDKTSDKLNYLGDLISSLEVRKGKSDAEVMELKKFYSILEVRHMLLISQRNDKCEGNYSIFMFIYSNSEECETEVEKASFILTYLRNKHDFVRVYSFDMDLESDIVGFFKNTYNIKGCYGVVLNESLLGKIEKAEDIENLIVKK